ncbi:MAG: uracil-DNA glycosylase [Verrucomicrobia bacterium]|nr:uracil-DNA glycosylase [Verrucomicrobiota bacterium]
MSLFEDGLEYLILHLRSNERLGERRFPRGILDQIRALGQLEAEAPLTEEQPSLAAPADPWTVPETSSPDGDLAAGPVAAETLETLRERVIQCRKCPHLVAFRHQVVFGTGNPHAELMFVGEAPGAEEDLRGEPFVGRAGELLTRIIDTMGFSRSEVYIANVLKCRPDMPPNAPGNRPPTPEEMQTCLPYLREQIALIRPRVMVALGGTAMQGLFGTARPMRELRGRWHSFGEIAVMATFHPSYLLRNQALSEKRKVWDDMLLVLEYLERPITDRQRAYFLAK